MNVTVIGTGYVGLTTGLALAYLGHDLTCVDKKPEIITTLSRGKATIHEAGIDTLLASTCEDIRFRSDLPCLRGRGVVLIAVGTPSRQDGAADLTYVDTAAREIAERIEPGAELVVVNKSTVPIGSARHVEGIIRRRLLEREVEAEVFVVSNPEFLAEGKALHDTFYPDRIVIGTQQPEAISILRELYAPLLEQTFEPPVDLPRPERYVLPPLITTTPTSAELTKYAANAFLATKISFINEFAGLAERIGADITEVARAIGLDERIGSRFLQAGIGWGGSCFGKDTRAIMSMAESYGYDMPVVHSAITVNYRQRERIVERLQEQLKVLRGTTIGLLGLAFKAGTNDLRDAPALTLIDRLVDRGAIVKVHDPVAMPQARGTHPDLSVSYCNDEIELALGCDAIVVVTEWPQYRQLPLARMAECMSGNLLLDARNFLSRDDADEAGLLYVGVGR